MNTEIERKFIVKEIPPYTDFSDIEQGYLCLGTKEEARIRKITHKGIIQCSLTVKKGSGMTRGEWETPIDNNTYNSLWSATEGRRLYKKRVHIVQDGVPIDVDIYKGSLFGLIVAEIEFQSEEKALEFNPLSWMGLDITDNDRYKNRELATLGIPESY